MKNITPLIVMLFCINTIIAQSSQPAVILISSVSTPEYIAEMKENLG